MSNWTGTWNYPTAVRFGPGRAAELPQACAELGITRPLLVTDRGLSALPLVGDVVGWCTQAGLEVAVFSDVQGNPVGENVDAGLAAFRAAGHDGVIGLGGGSALDVAKAIALMAHQVRPLWDFEDVGDNWTRVDRAAMAPLVALPTTSGTGSEVGRASVITDARTHTKKIIFHPGMLPAKVIADPLLSVGLPAKLTGWTGIDALSHNLEAWCAPGTHPMADGIALEGMQLIHEHLPIAVADGQAIPARSAMMAASMMGATAFQKGLGAMHALAHPIGAQHDTHHGCTNGVLMPYVLLFNRPAIEDRICRAARSMDLPGHDFGAFLDWVLALRKACWVPHSLAELGIEAAHIPDLVGPALADPSGSTNPRPLDASGVEQLLRAAIAGDLSQVLP